jgi:hypothetical protein
MKFNNFSVLPILIFCIQINKKKNEIGKTESRDDLYNVASKAAYQQMYVAYVFLFIYISNFY